MMCSLFLKNYAAENRGRFYRASERVFDAMLAFYRRSLWFVLQHRPAALVFTAAVMAASCVAVLDRPQGFYSQ
jgi:multidrug efflux pump subunit AcrB